MMTNFSVPTNASVQVSAGGEHTLIRQRDDNGSSLFVAGACGLGWCRNHPLNDALFGLRKVAFSQDGMDEPCSLFHASYYHNLAVGARSGKLYTWGCGTFTEGGLDGVIPALGQGSDAQDVGNPPKAIEMPTNDPIRAISGGAYHSIVLTEEGRSLFTFGAGQLGQLGRPTSGNDSSGLPVDPEPRKVVGLPSDEKIESIGAGFYNTLAICQSGKLFCSGENQNRQCGSGPKNLYEMTQVDEVADVSDAEGGYCHSLIQTKAGKLFSMGCSEEGQRGIGVQDDETPPHIITEVVLPGKERVSQVAAGANHSVVLSESGKVYTFGSNDVGQCGVPSDAGSDDEDDNESGVVWSPKEVLIPDGAGPVTQVSAGYAHTILTTQSQRVFTFGQNDSGQLGIGKQDGDEGLTEPSTRPVEVGMSRHSWPKRISVLSV
jgi:alpha-tubulin suppressor-like RCC1 family protein